MTSAGSMHLSENGRKNDEEDRIAYLAYPSTLVDFKAPRFVSNYRRLI